MIRKLIVFAALTAVASVPVFAQDVETSKEQVEKARQAYSIAIAGFGGYMGVGVKDVSSSNYQEFGLSEVKGVAITSIAKDSAAEKAGLVKGDVITAIDGQRVTSTKKFSRMVREIAPDHTVTLTVARGGSEIQIPVTMGSRRSSPFIGSGELRVLRELGENMPELDVPTPRIPPVAVFPEGAESLSFRTSRAIGVGVTSLTKQLGDYFGVADGKGILINDVSKDSPAERAGLRAGDVITKVNGKDVTRTFDLMRGLGDEGDVTITFVRSRSEQTVTVTPEKRSGNYFFFETKKDN